MNGTLEHNRENNLIALPTETKALGALLRPMVAVFEIHSTGSTALANVFRHQESVALGALLGLKFLERTSHYHCKICKTTRPPLVRKT